MALTEEFLPDLLTVKVATGAATISRIHQIKKDGVVISTVFVDPAPVEAVGPWSLAGILTPLQASTLAGKSAAEAQVATLTAEKEALRAALAALQAKYDLVAPPITIPMKFVRMALNKLGLASVWGAAVEATIATLEAAKDPDPKRVYNWWYDANEVNTEGGEGGLIVVEMCKADAWGASSLAELLALAGSIAAETASSPSEVT